ncbi:DnaJ-domain-containing protein [Conidiobolus coronatus NRRL 28638]|uniref:Diphthamide biosynthesis protein 4 n=1 Tax=Conidiobolus coronatus (strain ATCC 28846 / CBS 209.66 / NRRL 28638) TaxID=796925 RepID=A0A137P8W6_CONC2|nr:DnaJ-domain-containing protein [Conidiobolus coronatus NRRL 28638]|eukprot:KXN71445.1 DnaJ-domain-containing protein [Conidiobolus coronatus NRRL 28638]
MSIDDKTYYQYLNLSSTCEQSQIRINYQKLALLYHPDKREPNEELDQLFLKVQEAYEILKDPISRKDYDLSLTNIQYKDEGVINEEIEIYEMNFNEDEEYYYYTCRCGDYYRLDEQDLLNSSNEKLASNQELSTLVQCSNCSLIIKVHYQIEEEDLYFETLNI